MLHLCGTILSSKNCVHKITMKDSCFLTTLWAISKSCFAAQKIVHLHSNIGHSVYIHKLLLHLNEVDMLRFPGYNLLPLMEKA